MNSTDITTAVRSIVGVARDRDISFLAGSVAFFAFVSIIPTMLLALAVGSKLGGEGFTTRINQFVESYLSEQGNLVLSEALSNPSGRVGASIFGIVALFWSAIKVFRAIDMAFNRIYESDKSPSLPQQILRATIVLVAISAVFVLLIGLQVFVSRANIPYLSVARWPIMILGLAVIFLLLYYVMPPVDIPVRETVPGIVTAVVGLVVLQELFSVFASQASQYQAYGFIGVVLLFLLWLYFGAVILLSGALVNATLAGRATAPLDDESPVPEVASSVSTDQRGSGRRRTMTQRQWDRITGGSDTGRTDEQSDREETEPPGRSE
jgi:membrane protein